jgi:preprotein translocase SecE subunit
MNNQKHIVMTLLGLAFLVAISLRGLAIPILAKFEIGDVLLMNVISASSLGAVLIGLISFIFFNRNKAVVNFTNESWTELRRVFWPGKEETVRSTTVVIGVTLFIAFMLGLYDYVWAEVTQLFLFTKS